MSSNHFFFPRAFMTTTPSAPSPLPGACNTTMFYYHPPVEFPSIKSILGSCCVNEELLSPLSRTTMRICFLYFCRISELLNAQSYDVIHPDRVVLHGVKRSNSYIIFLPGLSDQMPDVSPSGDFYPLFPISYIKLYRDARRIGIRTVVKGSTNSRRLHCARYIFSKNSSKQIDGDELAGVLRHKSISSYLNYLK